MQPIAFHILLSHAPPRGLSGQRFLKSGGRSEFLERPWERRLTALSLRNAEQCVEGNMKRLGDGRQRVEGRVREPASL
jgi:hypothetical protein